MVINISKFFIISIDNFNKLISDLGVNLTIDSQAYLCTYLVANIFAYLIIFIFIDLMIKLYFELFSGRRKYK